MLSEGGGLGDGAGLGEGEREKNLRGAKIRFPGHRNKRLRARWRALKLLSFDCAPFCRKKHVCQLSRFLIAVNTCYESCSFAAPRKLRAQESATTTKARIATKIKCNFAFLVVWIAKCLLTILKKLVWDTKEKMKICQVLTTSTQQQNRSFRVVDRKEQLQSGQTIATKNTSKASKNTVFRCRNANL